MLCHAGPAACRRGDVVRCTVVFEEKEEIDEQLYKVPVVFTVNGSRVVPEAHDSCIEYAPDTSLYPQIGFYYENSVLAKVIKVTITVGSTNIFVYVLGGPRML